MLFDRTGCDYRVGMGLSLGSMRYCAALEYLRVSSMSQMALHGQFCIRSFLSLLFWDKKTCTG